MTNYLSLDEVLAIHSRMLEKGGGNEGINSLTLLHSAIERPKATFSGKDLYPTIWLKAAALIHSLIKNHPFNDGNKRTAYFSAMRLLNINGYNLVVKREIFVPFVIKIDLSKTIKPQNIAKWLQNHSKKLHPLQ